MTTTAATSTLTESQSRGLGALAARTQLRQIESGRRRELNRPDAWCSDRERHAGLRTSEGFDAWHDGWYAEVVDALREAYEAALAAEHVVVNRADNRNQRSLDAGWAAVGRTNEALKAYRVAIEESCRNLASKPAAVRA